MLVGKNCQLDANHGFLGREAKIFSTGIDTLANYVLSFATTNLSRRSTVEDN